jgi:hypothetical protein
LGALLHLPLVDAKPPILLCLQLHTILGTEPGYKPRFTLHRSVYVKTQFLLIIDLRLKRV